MTKIKLPELLAPAGTLDAFKTAILYGADAIYAGLPGFSMRARAKITTDEVKQGIELAHAAGKKVYLAFNLFAHDFEYAHMPRVADTIRYLQPDALIVSDPGIVMWVKSFPSTHLSFLPTMIQSPISAEKKDPFASWTTICKPRPRGGFSLIPKPPRF